MCHLKCIYCNKVSTVVSCLWLRGQIPLSFPSVTVKSATAGPPLVVFVMSAFVFKEHRKLRQKELTDLKLLILVWLRSENSCNLINFYMFRDSCCYMLWIACRDHTELIICQTLLSHEQIIRMMTKSCSVIFFFHDWGRIITESPHSLMPRLVHLKQFR